MGIDVVNAGLFSPCHPSFFAVAAYATAILQVLYGVPTILAGDDGVTNAPYPSVGGFAIQ